MAINYSLICNNGQNAGSFFDLLSTADKSRYGSPGTYRCYGSIAAWLAARMAVAQNADTEWLEFADAFTDALGSTSLPLMSYAAFPAYKIIIETRIKGVRTSAFHGGNPSAGYKITNNSGYMGILMINRSNVIVDGLNLDIIGAGACAIRAWNGANQTVCNNIARSQNDTAFRLQGVASNYFNNIGYGSSINFQFDSYSMSYSKAYNNLAVKGGTGFCCNGNPTQGNYHSNAAIGNITDWSSPPTSPSDGGMRNNFGPPGSTPWGTGAVTTLTTADFIDYANNDFRIVEGSVLRDAGYNFLDISDRDIIGVLRPNFSDGEETLDTIDAGPFEYDSGHGEPPITITVDGMVSGSIIRASRVDTGAVIYSGVGPGFPTGYMGATNIEVRCASSAPFYRPWQTQVTPTAGVSMTVTALQESDEE